MSEKSPAPSLHSATGVQPPASSIRRAPRGPYLWLFSAWIEAPAVKAKLSADRFSNLLNVDVNVTNGVVTLAGEVPNAQVKAEAEREARSVSGVTRVINNLQVKAPPSR